VTRLVNEQASRLTIVDEDEYVLRSSVRLAMDAAARSA
jgi:hypothetical protein